MKWYHNAYSLTFFAAKIRTFWVKYFTVNNKKMTAVCHERAEMGSLCILVELRILYCLEQYNVNCPTFM